MKQRTVALKRLPVALAVDAEFQARFRRESALAARLSEPHIIPIHDYGEIDGQLFIDMRLVAGRDLATMLAATVWVGGSPQGVAVSPDVRRAYTANSSTNTVSVIDLGGRRTQ